MLRRDPLCQVCGQEPSIEADHIIRGDDHSLANLQGIGSFCHGKKSSAEGIASRRAGGGYLSNRRKPEPHPGLRA